MILKRSPRAGRRRAEAPDVCGLQRDVDLLLGHAEPAQPLREPPSWP